MSEKHKYHEACHKIAELEQEIQYYKDHHKSFWEKCFPKKEDKMECECKHKRNLIAYFVKLNPNAIIPERAEVGSVGYDVYTDFNGADYNIGPGETGLLHTGIVAIPPKGFHWELVLRSSTPKKKEGIVLANSVGIIDPSYCGPKDEIRILILNTSKEIKTFYKGERVAQLILRENLIPEVQEVSIETIIANDDRGGFGSTTTEKEKKNE